MEVLKTVVSGTLVYVLGQFILKILIEPIQELRKYYQNVVDDWIYYKNIISNMTINDEKFNEEKTKVAGILRKHASKLKALKAIIPFYKIFIMLEIVPEIDELSSKFFLISNLLKLSKIENKNKSIEEILSELPDTIKKIDKLLKIHV